MEDVILISIVAAFFALCYAALSRFGRFMEKVRRDTRKHLSGETEEERERDGRSQNAGAFRSQKTGREQRQ